MARFRGTVRGGRGEASRLGHKTTGLVVKARGWGGSVDVVLSTRDDKDWAFVVHTDSGGHDTTLYNGPLDRYKDPRGTKITLALPTT
jgi:hypothetical protein